MLNSCLDRMRRRRARPTDPIVEVDLPAARDPIADHIARLDVARALAQLPVAQRLAVVLVDMQGFGIAEAAEILETREGTVKSRCARGRVRLAELLGHMRTEAPIGDAGNAGGAADVEQDGGEDR